MKWDFILSTLNGGVFEMQIRRFHFYSSMPHYFLLVASEAPHGWIETRDSISVKLIYRHFLKYRLSVTVTTNKISAIGIDQITALNIDYILVIFPWYIGKTLIYL